MPTTDVESQAGSTGLAKGPLTVSMLTASAIVVAFSAEDVKRAVDSFSPVEGAQAGGYSRSAAGSAALARPAATARSIVQACPSARPRSNATGSPAARAAASLAGRS